MKFSRLLFTVMLMLASHTLCASIKWHTDYAKVRSLSQQENKPLLLFFNGSDWSGQAMQMKHEVLCTSSFEEKIASRFICMEADFPEHSALSEKHAAQNQELKARFHIQELPTLLLLDPQERVIAQVGYLPESGQQFAEDLLRLVEQDGQLVAGLKNLGNDPLKLKTLYLIAQELGRQPALDQIIEAGLKTDNPYFFLEKYRLLVENGEMKTAQSLALREKVCALDPENVLGVHFTLALIDFQELSQKNYPPDEAVQPLVNYLGRFGCNDPKNVWSVEMMIAQHYMDVDAREKALQHAEKALKMAPPTMHDEIAHSLDYIRAASAHK